MTTHEKHQLPVPVHRIRGDRRQQPARRPGRIARGQGRRKRPPARRVARRVRRRADGGGHRDGRAVPPRRPAVHVRQRRQLHRRRDAGVAVQPARPRPAGRGLVAGRRRGGGDGAGQRRRIRADLQAPDHRPCPRPRHRDRAVDVGQLGRSDDGDHRGQAAGTVDHRVRRPRRRPDGRSRRPRLLLHRALPEHPPHPGEPRMLGYRLWSVAQEHMARPVMEAA